MKRYSIMVVQRGVKFESELCQVDSGPHAMAEAVAKLTLRIDSWTERRVRVPKYDSVRVVDHTPDRVEGEAPDKPAASGAAP